MITEDNKIQNEGVIAENMDVQGQQIAFRDINNIEQKTEFVTLDPEWFANDNFVAPVFMEEAIEQLCAKRVIIVGEGYDFDKSDFVLHLALAVNKKFHALEIKEEHTSDDSIEVIKALRKTDKSAIFLFGNLHPKAIDFAIEKVIRMAYERNFFIVIGTDAESNIWGLTKELYDAHWFSIPSDKELYSPEAISAYLEKRILDEKHKLPFYDLEIENVSEKLTFAENAPFSWVSLQLKNPSEVDYFLDQLMSFNENPQTKELEKIIRNATDKETSLISRWFRKKSRKEQLIIISAFLMEGMYDDQYFSVLHDIVKDYWEYSVPEIQAVDYYDLEFLSGFFRFEAYGNEQALVIKSTKFRKELIQTAWESHRRHIMVVFPKLLDIIRDTIQLEKQDWEKFGTRKRRMVLRQSIGNTISDIGLVSFNSVQSVLLELAAHSVNTTQVITAKALARWRGYEEDDKLFSVLESWLHEGQVESLVNELLNRKELKVTNGKLNKKAPEYIRATIVTTLGYAAKYDNPNQLHVKIIELLKDLVKSNLEMVQNRLIIALPKIIHHHSLQLKNDLTEFMVHDYLTDAIGAGLARAYNSYPKDIKSTIDSLLDLCLQEASKDNRRAKATKRDNILITILSTLQNIDFEEVENGPINSNYILDVIEKFQPNERRNIVRTRLIVLGAKMAMLDFENALLRMNTLFRFLGRDERLVVIDQWLSMFFEQRAQLPGSEYVINIGDQYYPAWENPDDRPLTQIEQVMFDWMASDNKTAKEYATLCFIGIAKSFEEQERQALYELARRNKERAIQRTIQIATQRAGAVRPAVRRERGLPFWQRLYIFFVLLFENKANREGAKAIVRLLLNSNHYSKLHLALVFAKWRKRGNTAATKLALWLGPLFR